MPVSKVDSASGTSSPKKVMRAGRSQPKREVKLIPIPLASEIEPGDSLADKLIDALREENFVLESGDILVIKHKIVSKAENRLVDLATVKPLSGSLRWAKRYGFDARLIELAVRESRAVIRRKNGVLITETRHGFICANSGVDLSNVDGGRHALLLPVNPDRSAQRLYRELKERTALSIPILITDSFGRPWREGLVDFCIGLAGMKPVRDDRGHRDPHGYLLHASVEAIADELACAAGLVCGKLNRTPACVVRGFSHVPARGRARQLLRPAANDLFR
jgi:coenzyme F420-0:L-glutamate ligase / coenzyme F420-1:gamma-L-glutamate ligase